MGALNMLSGGPASLNAMSHLHQTTGLRSEPADGAKAKHHGRWRHRAAPASAEQLDPI